MKTTLEVDLKRVALEKARTFAQRQNSDLASLVAKYIEELAEKQGQREKHSMRPQPHHPILEGPSHTGHFLG